MPPASKAERAVDRFEPVGQRQIPDPPLLQPRAAAELRLVERAGHTGSEVRGPGAANVPEEPLQDSEVGIPLGRHVDRPRLEADSTGDLERGALPFQLQLLDPHDVAIERQLDRTAVAQRIVEQFQIELLDAGIHEEVIHVSELAADADGPAGNRIGERRQPRLEKADVRIERRLGEPQRHLDVLLLAQANAPRSRHRES